MNERPLLASGKGGHDSRMWVSAGAKLQAAFDQTRPFAPDPKKVWFRRKRPIKLTEADHRHHAGALLTSGAAATCLMREWPGDGMIVNQDRNEARYQWRRLWISPGDGRGIGARGLFSADLHSMSRPSEQPEARTLQALEDVPVLLLRGESGAGKTVALLQEAERLRLAGGRVELIDLAEGTVDVTSLFANLLADGYPVILLDGLDEAQTGDRNLDVALRRALSGLVEHPDLRLRIAVRSGFAVHRLVALLTDKFADGFEHLTLAPLRAGDVMIAARAEGIDPTTFLPAVEGLRVAPLAARPPTLRMLLRLWRRDGKLPTRRQDMYREGCAVLLRENNSGRLGDASGNQSGLAGELGTAERLAVAARLAAMMIFGDRDRLDLAGESSYPALSLDAAVGGAESVLDGEVRVTATSIREVVGSALFRLVGPTGFGFVHPSFAHFLAATFVKARGMPPEQTATLLSAPDGRVGANRVDVASWLGALDAPYFKYLCRHDPQVLLRSGIPPEPLERRIELAQALLTAGKVELIDVKELEVTRDLVLVASPGLQNILEPIISDSSGSPARRVFAARIARDTGCVPTASCAVVAMNEAEPIEVRRMALAALATRPNEAADTFLALSDADEPDEGLRLAALGITMRRLLSPADVIRRLKPRPRISSQSFLVLSLLRTVGPESLPDAMRAITDIAVGGLEGEQDNHLTIVQSLSGRAFLHLDDVAVRDALADLVARLPPVEPWVRWSFPLHKSGLPGSATTEMRHALVTEVARRAPDSGDAAQNLLEASFLLRNEDLAWLLSKAIAALGGQSAAIWTTLATEVARGCGGAPYGHLKAEGATDPEIQSIAYAALPMPLDFERWTPPRNWDSSLESFMNDEGGNDPEVDEEEDGEPGISAWVDAQLLAIQAAAGGRAEVPSIEPDRLLALARLSEARLVSDSSDLLRVITDSLARLQRRLKGRDPLVRALWNEGATPRPKDENFLSDFIVDHLRQDLVRGAIVADREVQLRPRLRETQGQRTDIQVQAFAGGRGKIDDRPIASLTIEVKGCWNKDLYVAMQSQLLDRYLAATGETVGLYVVGWYACAAWKGQRIAGRAPAVGTTLDVVTATLKAQAARLSDTGHSIEVTMIDATLA